jgi:hypothetical protein
MLYILLYVILIFSMVLREWDQYNDNVCIVHVPIRESGLARAIVSLSHSYRLYEWVIDMYIFLFYFVIYC